MDKKQTEQTQITIYPKGFFGILKLFLKYKKDRWNIFQNNFALESEKNETD
jgi:hypothetical protein